ncbi:MAG: FAD binding domain-containing protein [Vicinamibacterales bacterium]
MKPAPFEYYRPETLEEGLHLLAEHGDQAKPLAGGQSLIPAMNFRLARPAVLVDINQIRELSHIEEKEGELFLGGLARQRDVERSALVRRTSPLLHETMPFVAHLAIRNRGTVGGSLAHADPAAELPAVAVALEARLRARSLRSDRWIPADEFFTGLFSTALNADELLVEIVIPRVADRTGCAFEEVSRRHGDYALAGSAAVITLDAKGRCESGRVVLLSVGDRPILAEQAGRILNGAVPSADVIHAAAEAVARHDIDPPADIHASSAYRRHLAAVLTRRALGRAVARARETLQ